MADDRKHIDELFKDYLSGFKAAAPAGAWQRIQVSLQPTQKRKHFLYLRLAAASLLLLMAFSAGYFWSEFKKSDNVMAVSEITKSVQEQTFPDRIIENNNQNLPSENSKTLPSKKPTIAPLKPETIKIQSSKNDESLVNTAFENIQQKPETEQLVLTENKEDLKEIELSDEIITVETTGAINKTDDLAKKSESEKMTPEMLHQLLVGNNDALADGIIQKSNVQQPQQWSIGGQFSPVYSYRKLDGAGFSTPDEQVDKDYYNNTENGLMAYAGGISLNYGFNDRLSLASGLYLSRIGQENTDVVAYDSPDSPYLYNLASSGGTVTINPQKFEKVMVREVDNTKDSVPGDYIVNGTFIQNLDYLEVPLVLKYKLLKSKLSVNLSGGLSPGILVNNRSYFNVDGQKIQTGYTENIKPMIYNSVMGVGVEYTISTKLSINLDPLFKYSLSPINNNSGLKYHPYSISFFTGITYKL